MLNNLKLWLYGIIAAIVAGAIGMIRVLTVQRDRARDDAKTAKDNHDAVVRSRDAQKDIDNAIRRAREDAQKHESEINTSKRPDADARFDDERLRRKR